MSPLTCCGATRRVRGGVIASQLALAVASCDTPRDPDGTLDRVRDGTMRVGVVAAPPWTVVDSAGQLSGVEVALVSDLARALNARVEWVRRPESQLLDALHSRELDLVVGGLTDGSPWRQKVAFTRPYYTDTVIAGVRPGGALASLEGQRVAIEQGDPLAADLRKRKAVVVEVRDLAQATDAVAVPTWRLAALGRAAAGPVIREDRHVMAAPPGENAWLVRVERRLREHEQEVPAMLRSSAR